MAGFAIFSVLGFMSYEQGLPISEVAASGKTISVTGPMAENDNLCSRIQRM